MPAYLPSAKESEHEAQSTVVEWCWWHRARHPELRWLFATVNGAKLPYRKTRSGGRYSREAVKLKQEGLNPGVSDLCLPVPRNEYCGLWIEMKVGNNKTTDDQREFIADMNALGYLAIVCYGSDNAIASIATYLGIPKEEWW